MIDGVVNFVDPDPKVKVSALISGDAATLEFFVQPFNGTISSFGLGGNGGYVSSEGDAVASGGARW